VSGAHNAEKKALLATRAELDRARVMLAVHEIKTIVAPGADADRLAGTRPLASMFVRIGGPIFGTVRLGRWLRIASIALFALRIVRGWK
jgi:hypothetical protein